MDLTKTLKLGIIFNYSKIGELGNSCNQKRQKKPIFLKKFTELNYSFMAYLS